MASTLNAGGKSWRIHPISTGSKLPYSLKILLENLVRSISRRGEDGVSVRNEDIEALTHWSPKAEPSKEIAFSPSRVLLQDFTGVPCVVDLAAMRDAMKALGGDPNKINPLQPVELVIDHSVQVDHFGSHDALSLNAAIEFQRNKERYQFLRWGQTAFRNFRVVPPSTGIVHQVNLEFLARVVMTNDSGDAYPDTLVGTDSHTTMVNGLGVLGWGVGGIEAEAAMLGQPVSMLIPQVVGFRLSGKLAEGATATDLVLTVTQMLRKKGVVGKFVEFFGPGIAALALADRATIANMAPEYGATCGIFPVDKETLRYLTLTGRSKEQVELVEAYARAQGMFHDEKTPEAEYTDTMELDLAKVEPSMAGPKRPQDRVTLSGAGKSFRDAAPSLLPAGVTSDSRPTKAGDMGTIDHGSVVIAAITSCTNTSNPSVLVGAGLLAKKAVEKGLTRKPWVKSSLAPGSKVVTEYLAKAGLQTYLDQLGFDLVGYGCTTCIGNSGPLPEAVSHAVEEGKLAVVSVLSGNRNFEGRVHPEVRANYLASPPLVVAYALSGTIDKDLTKEPIGKGKDGNDVYLKDIWPTSAEIEATVRASLGEAEFKKVYSDVFLGDERWQKLETPKGDLYAWDDKSTYVRNPPYFEDMTKDVIPPRDIVGARVLAFLADSITTDHISPAGSIKKGGPAAVYLESHGVKAADYNQYGARRGNHEVMVRGTFANVRLKNKLAPGTEGGVTRHLPDGKGMSIFDASAQYREEGVPLVVLAGKEYGSGSSRDWAAKGPMLLGVRVVIAESYERIHRSNLVGMGILPLEYETGQTAESHGLTGEEVYSFTGIANGASRVAVTATRADGSNVTFEAKVRIDTPKEREYFTHGGILQFVLRQLLKT